jgi:hypothetical protein
MDGIETAQDARVELGSNIQQRVVDAQQPNPRQ